MSKKWLALALKFLVSGFLIWFLLKNINFDEALTRMAEVEPGMLAAAVLVLFFQICIGGLRWGAVLTAIGTPLGFTKAIQIFYIGAFFSQVLPSAVGGDAVRMYKAYKENIGLRGALNGVILERAVTVAALVVLVAATQPWFLPRVDEAARALILPGIGLVILAAAGGLVFLMALDRLPETLRRWRVIRGLGNLGIDGRRVFLSARHLPRVMALGLLTHINMSLCVFALASGLGLAVTWIDCLVLVPLVLLIMTVPISIGGWGVRETAMVALFGLIGVAGEGALALSVMFGLTGLAVSIPGGVVWLASRNKGEPLTYETPDPASGPDGGN